MRGIVALACGASGGGGALCDHPLMQITNPCVVSLTWTLADAQGNTLDELSDPVEFYYGGDDLLAKLEEALAGQAEGFECDLHLEPEHGFGDYDPALVCFEPRALFPPNWNRACSSTACPKVRRPPTCPPT